MNRRIINQILCSKHKTFVESITDPMVKDLVEKNSIITGGSIASMLLKEPVKDFDYYFTNRETVFAVAQYYVEKFNTAHPEIEIKPKVVVSGEQNERIQIKVQSAGVTSENGDDGYAYFEQLPEEAGMDYVDKVVTDADDTNAKHLETMGLSEEAKSEKKNQSRLAGDFRPVFLSANAITLSDKVQLVIRFYGDATEIHKNYDYIHCCNYWTSADKQVVLNPAAIESLLNRELRYQGSVYPLCSVIRMRKFLKNGWHIGAGEILKMCFQISKLDLSNIEVLEDQLTGVDAAYFIQLIRYCQQEQSKNLDFVVTAPYLVSLVDKIWGH